MQAVDSRCMYIAAITFYFYLFLFFLIVGCDNLYKEVNELVSRSAESLAKMQALEEKLCITNEEQRQ